MNERAIYAYMCICSHACWHMCVCTRVQHVHMCGGLRLASSVFLFYLKTVVLLATKQGQAPSGTDSYVNDLQISFLSFSAKNLG